MKIDSDSSGVCPSTSTHREVNFRKSLFVAICLLLPNTEVSVLGLCSCRPVSAACAGMCTWTYLPPSATPEVDQYHLLCILLINKRPNSNEWQAIKESTLPSLTCATTFLPSIVFQVFHTSLPPSFATPLHISLFSPQRNTLQSPSPLPVLFILQPRQDLMRSLTPTAMFSSSNRIPCP